MSREPAPDSQPQSEGFRGLVEQNWVFDEIMDKMGASVYVTDIETDEILFMNQTMKRVFAMDHPEGKICWQVLQKDMNSRCEFCPVHELTMDETGKASRMWEENNTLTGRTYENYDSLMRWVDGRVVHFQHSIDITETKRLYAAASIDELTGAYSRRRGKEELEGAMQSCRGRGVLLTVCMLDLNGLKAVNDLNGHQAGDALLKAVSMAVNSVLEQESFLFRLSGDEFVAVFPGSPKEEAEKKMRLALQKLALEPLYPGDRHEAAFCFGIVEVGPNREVSLNRVLSEADERLYEQKKHGYLFRELNRRPGREGGEAQGFNVTYDLEKLYEALALSTDDYIYICNVKEGVSYYPQPMVEEFALPGQIVKNSEPIWENKVHMLDQAAFLNAVQNVRDGRADSLVTECRVKNRSGEWVWLRCRGRLIRNSGGGAVLLAGFVSNLGVKSNIDPLTGLFNQAACDHDLERLLAEQGGRRALTVMLLGIDGLERINRLHDRVFGDEVIRIVSRKLQTALPANAYLYRLDGAEFAVAVAGPRNTAQDIFTALQSVFSTQQAFDRKKFYCSLSCGCVSAENETDKAGSLLKCARIALDYAKSKGSNRLEWFSEDVMLHMERSLKLTELLKESIDRGFEGFSVAYQPVFTSGRELSGAEALARFHCEKYGDVPPEEFISLLESNGMIQQFGRWVFEQAVRQGVAWRTIRPGFLMGVNMSYLQLEDPAFPGYVRKTLEKEGLPPCNLILELTESYLAANIDALKELLAGLKGIGIKVAMDDFGTGYSSLGVLKQVPVDIVKIDRAFVKGIQKSAFDHSFLRMVVELCHVAGIAICLEGIEQEEEFRMTRPMEINFLQGFLLGKPVPPLEFEALFLRG